jgi:cell division control protein 6
VFENGDTGKEVLQDETYLTNEYQPEEPVGRKPEIQRLVDVLQPSTERRKPENLYLYGPAGVGKTTCVKHVFDRLENESSTKAVYINCWQYNTRSSLLTELLLQLNYPVPRKGKPVDELLSKLREWLNKNRGIVIALDEFDQLDHSGEVIYDFQLLNNQTKYSIGTILLSNKPPATIYMDQRSQSRLSIQSLRFEPYSADQLTRILEDRVEQSFRAGTVPDEVVQRVADHVAENRGDCRKALEILLQAGREADRQDKSRLTPELVEI